MASSSANRKPSTVEEIFNDFKLRRTALITALTTKVDEFELRCREFSVSGTPFYVYGRSDGQWRVLSPIGVQSDFPQPTIWLNLPMDSEERISSLCTVAVHSDSWLLAMIGYYTARLSRVERMTVMCLTCTEETVYEMVARFYHHGDPETTGDHGLTALADAAAATDPPTALTAGVTALTAAPLTTDPTTDSSVCDPDLPRTTDWIACDKCESWYHELCTGLSLAQLKIARGADFICSECESSG